MASDTVLNTIVISGGGTVAVATDQLIGIAQSLEAIRDGSLYSHRALVMIDSLVSSAMLRQADAPLSAADAENALEEARALLVEANERAEFLAGALRLSARAYGVAEHTLESLAEELAARAGFALGVMTPMAVIAALPALLLVGQALGIVALVPGGREAMTRTATAWMADHRDELTNPLVVALIRLAVQSSDDYIGGLIGLPPEVSRALGDEGLGLTGVNTTAGLVALAAGAFGLMKETPVRVQGSPTTGFIGGKPLGIADRLDRVPGPESATGTARVRIDRFEHDDGEDSFEVYIAGTVNWDVRDSDTPFDLTSNIRGVAELDPGSREAVELAMADAGITDSSAVVFTGYSQGGLIARAVAASGDWNTAGLVTFGGPGGQIELPADVPALVIDHTDDFVPALGGVESSTTAVHVERQVYADRTFDNEFVVPAHERSNYRDTAALIDTAESSQLRATLDAIDRASAGGRLVSSTSYTAERVSG